MKNPNDTSWNIQVKGDGIERDEDSVKLGKILYLCLMCAST